MRIEYGLINADTIARVGIDLDPPEKIENKDLFKKCLSNDLNSFDWFKEVNLHGYSHITISVDVDYDNLLDYPNNDNNKKREKMEQIKSRIEESVHRCLNQY
ncbi:MULTISPECIES: hypothetical protein [Methanobacterium]|uniref:Uncharacterized protein n=1 Tax=Methanobacterium veterum TaxID=408577 RepID=A0A9E5A000_9EURY|nr:MULTISPECIES: hypothetical protein [Methanobacterium]MCZ3367068.1 hypothetical protein [Methanobacterium veterum]MCZ3373785.1 hypothetical protein [Methanobacterium veterum]